MGVWPSDYYDPVVAYEIDLDVQRPERRPPAELDALPYREYLASPEWQETRRQKLNLAGYRCERCGRRDGQNGRVAMRVHHRSYAYVGAEDVYDELECLCLECHEQEHGL